MKTLVSVSFFILIHISLGEKRLLLTDPDVLAARINHLETTVKDQAETIKHLVALISNTVQHESLGSTFVHWGRSDCPAQNTELVYKGYTGGGASNETGSSPDYVCLPEDPKLKPTTAHDYGRIYGTEYDTDFWGHGVIHNDVPCAVCRSKFTSSSIMIPGKDACYAGWKVEYHGYLGSSHHLSTSGSSLICVDASHENIPGGVAYSAGKILVNVVAKCGSLQCPPYINGQSFTCVVCSK